MMNIKIPRFILYIFLGTLGYIFLGLAFPGLEFLGRLYTFLSIYCFYWFIKIIEKDYGEKNKKIDHE